MYPGKFSYYRPESVEEALEVIAELGDEARFLAGGQSLIPMMKLRLAAPAHLVDLNAVPGLSGIRREGAAVHVGALTRHSDMEAETWPAALALLGDASGVIADVQVRNRGTVGGALSQADPNGDWGPALLALGGTLSVRNREGERKVALSEFFLGPYTTALADSDLLSGISLEGETEKKAGSAYLALKRRAGDFAIASAAASLVLGDDGRCERAGLSLGNVAFTPVRAEAAEKVLEGSPVDGNVIAEAVKAAGEVMEPMSDHHGTADFKRQVASTLLGRAIEAAYRRALGERVNVRDYL